MDGRRGMRGWRGLELGGGGFGGGEGSGGADSAYDRGEVEGGPDGRLASAARSGIPLPPPLPHLRSRARHDGRSGAEGRRLSDQAADGDSDTMSDADGSIVTTARSPLTRTDRDAEAPVHGGELGR